jgi:serine/threonine protein kinase
MTSSSSPFLKFGRYESRDLLSRQRSSSTYDAWDPDLDRHVAIKVLPLLDHEVSGGREGMARFRRGVQIVGQLYHPSIVGIYDYGETNDSVFIVMEFVEGRSIKQLFEEGKRFSIAETVGIMGQVLDALQFGHDRGVMHGGLEPRNVIISMDGRVKLADFGIARIQSSMLMQGGTILGSPAYMSPEQLSAQSVGIWSDIYSAGVLLYLLLTGKRPFEGDLTTVIQKVLTTVPPRPSTLSPTVPTHLDLVVERAMARPPNHRYPNAAVFASALRGGFSSPAAAKRPSSIAGSARSADPFGRAFGALFDAISGMFALEPGVEHSPRAKIPPPTAQASGPPEEPTRKQREQREGSILWNPPSRMKVGRRERLEVRVGDVDVAEKILCAGLRGKGIPLIDRLEVAPLMRVVLIADSTDFSILVLGNADQYVRSGEVARWDFDVTPLRSGRRLLRVLASMRVKVEGKDEIVDLPSFEREVEVAVAPFRATGRFCAQNWKWIAGTIILPAMVWAAGKPGLLDAGSKHIREFFIFK